MAVNEQKLIGSPVTLLVGETRAYAIDASDACDAPSAPANALYDLYDGSSAAALLSGSASVSTTTITTKLVTPTSGYAGHILRLATTYTCSGALFIDYLDIEVRLATDTTLPV